MSDYFCLDIETMDYRNGVAYYEFIDGTPTRQVTNVDDLWLSSRRDHHPAVGPLLTDQLLQPGEFDEDDRITANEFEEAWRRAIEQEGEV
ncbi:hypothetical protein [Streptomyces olivaceiscleroticus]|uniref:EF-hand domain-containing protein n=1 Tax=Streptomyces olivaceiscleroticus TaxID=68245 RepID=A0ABP3L1I7_9ACTN